MAKQIKQFSKDTLITNINMVINNKNKYFCIIYKSKVEYVEYIILITMSLATILDLISKGKIYIAKVIIKEKEPMIKLKDNTVKSKNTTISNCKSSLNDIYD